MAKKKKNLPAPVKMGRPTAYTVDLCATAIQYFDREPWVETTRTITRKDGSEVTEEVRLPAELPTLAGLACQLGVHRDTINEWQAKHPEFSDAIKRAKAHQERILVANGLCGLYEGAFGIFTAKNILGWRDRQEHEHGLKPGDPIAALMQAITARIGGGRLSPPA